MQYYIIIDKKQVGPLSFEEVFNYPVTPETQVWYEGLSGWISLREEPVLFNEYNVRVQERKESTPPPYGAPYGTERMRNGQFYGAGTSSPSYIPPKPPTYLAWSIINVVCCCLITGIIAIVYSTKIDTLYKQGQYEEAIKKSKLVFHLNLWTMIIYPIIVILYFIFVFYISADRSSLESLIYQI